VNIETGEEQTGYDDSYTFTVCPSAIPGSFTTVTDPATGVDIGYKLGRIEIVNYDDCSSTLCNTYYEPDPDNYFVNFVYFDGMLSNGDRYEYVEVLKQILRTESPTLRPTLLPTPIPIILSLPTPTPTATSTTEETQSTMIEAVSTISAIGNHANQYYISFIMIFVFAIC